MTTEGMDDGTRKDERKSYISRQISNSRYFVILNLEFPSNMNEKYECHDDRSLVAMKRAGRLCGDNKYNKREKRKEQGERREEKKNSIHANQKNVKSEILISENMNLEHNWTLLSLRVFLVFAVKSASHTTHLKLT